MGDWSQRYYLHGLCSHTHNTVHEKSLTNNPALDSDLRLHAWSNWPWFRPGKTRFVYGHSFGTFLHFFRVSFLRLSLLERLQVVYMSFTDGHSLPSLPTFYIHSLFSYGFTPLQSFGSSKRILFDSSDLCSGLRLRGRPRGFFCSRLGLWSALYSAALRAALSITWQRRLMCDWALVYKYCRQKCFI